MEKWNLTEDYLPDSSGLYLVTRTEESPNTNALWFFTCQGDWDGDFYDKEEYGDVEFPVWCELDLHEDVTPEYFSYYVADTPYAWMELPDPCGKLESEEFNETLENVNELFGG